MKVHLIGIGGTGMGALALLLRSSGHEVRGSDANLYPPMSTQLARASIPVFEGYDANNLDWGPDVVVVGNVCSSQHPEVVAAQGQSLRLASFPSLLAETLLEGRQSLVVAGTHGKTTTSSLLAWMLDQAGLQPSWMIGGVPRNMKSGAELGEGKHFVLEGDEYDTAFFDKESKFFHYRAQSAILTSVEYDHVDIFKSVDDLLAAFRRFASEIPADGYLVLPADDVDVMKLTADVACKRVTVKVQDESEVVAESVDYVVRVLAKGSYRRTTFEIVERGESLGEFSTLMVGRYNLANIVSAFALARTQGAELERLRLAIRDFRGVKRRQELLGIADGVRIVEDFAHHPSAVKQTVAAIRKRFPKNNLHVCFEPRSSSSRRDVFFEQYAEAFDLASQVYIAPLFAPEKVPEDQRLDTLALARQISNRGVNARAFQSVGSLANGVLEEMASGDTVLCLSCGSFGGLTRMLLDHTGDAVLMATPDDVAGIDRLLENYKLPKLEDPDLLESLVIRNEGEVIASVNLQMAGEHGFFFGLAVDKKRRAEGLGWVLADTMLKRARTLGARTVTLIAGGASDFFADKLGFVELQIGDVDPEIRACSNFQAWQKLEQEQRIMRLELDHS